MPDQTDLDSEYKLIWGAGGGEEAILTFILI